MCIALLSTSHPKYPFILLNNRDEFLSRPTLDADWWDPPDQDVLGGRDAQRAERGTWLGITRTGRIAILTNFREEGVEVTRDKSRGAIPATWLTGPSSTDGEDPTAFASYLINNVGIHDVGGFTLLFGTLRRPDAGGHMPGLSVLSNRSASAEDVRQIATSTGETHGLSNSHFGDTTWPKVVHGEKLLEQAIVGSLARDDAQDMLIESLFEILSIDMLRQRQPDESWEVYVRQMRNSILIPPLKGQSASSVPEGGLQQNGHASAERLRADVNGTSTPTSSDGAGYGTQKQTVVLVDREGHVTFVERTLYDEKGREVAGDQRTRRFEFDVDSWDG